MVNKQHWETVYQTKAADAVSWYRPHLDTSLDLIAEAVPDRDAERGEHVVVFADHNLRRRVVADGADALDVGFVVDCFEVKPRACVFIANCRPCSHSHFISGRTIESFWL